MQRRSPSALNGADVAAAPGETIIEAADRLGVEIPRLCYKPGYRPDGNCRACMVEIKGERALAPSCCRQPTAGMVVPSNSARAVHSQKMIVELLASDMPERSYKTDSELDYWRRALNIGTPRFARRAQPAADLSHPAMAVNLDACIQCTRCVRACREEQVNDVIGYAFRGAHSKIVFDLDDPMGASTCVACGECVQACPTGALAPAHDAFVQPIDSKVASVCPYCGVGCQITYNVQDNRIVHVEGRDGPANHQRLCVKGRFGFDYVSHPHRLTKPLIRKPGMPKSADFTMDPADPLSVFREATWDEALALAGGTLRRIRDMQGSQALAGFGSAKGSNEEAYLFQKLVRTGFGTNNVDHCTRLCHASSVAALLEGIGSGAVSNPVMDVDEGRRHLPHRRQPRLQPSGRGHVDQERRQERHETDPRRSAPIGACAARDALPAVQARQRRRDAERADAHDRRGRSRRPSRSSRTAPAATRSCARTSRSFSPEAMAPICGIDAARRCATVARLFATSQGVDDPVGHGHLAARARHRQRALPDRAVADDRARSAGPAPACIRCAARTTCRARPTSG